MYNRRSLSERIRELKARITMRQLLKKYNVGLKRDQARCPLPGHDEDTPSFFLRHNKNKFKCFGCGKGGDIVDFVKLMERCDNVRAVELLEKIAGISDVTYQPAPVKYTVTNKQKTDNTPSEKSMEVYRYYFNSLTLTEQGAKYMNSRGISAQTTEKFSIRSQDSPKEIGNSLCSRFSITELQQAGLFSQNSFYLFNQEAVIFPYFYEGEPVYFSMRSMRGNRKHLKMRGKQKLYTGNLEDADRVVVFEGIIDALSYYQLTERTDFISFNGQLSAANLAGLQEFIKMPVWIAFDNDIPGAMNRWKLEDLNLVKNVLEYADKEDEVYYKIRNDFEFYKDAADYFSKPVNRKNLIYSSKIKDVNDLIKQSG